MKTNKTYYEFMNEISSEEIYEGLFVYGLFNEKLPPVFSVKNFFTYIKKNKKHEEKERDFIRYESMRNINIPRQFGIPDPVAYHQLCECISENWSEIKQHFKEQTEGQQHIISRIHIRKQKHKNLLFEMNYKNWRDDGTPEPDLLIGAKYIVHADISNCFPSIYTMRCHGHWLERRKLKNIGRILKNGIIN